MPTLTEIGAEIKTRLDENDTLTAKGDAFTQEDALKVGENNTRLGELSADREKMVAALGGKAANDALRQKMESPVPTFAHPSTVAPGQVLGFTKAGETETDGTGNGFSVKSVGAGHIDARQLAAIRSTDYKDSYVKMLRVGFASLSNVEQKALQEGQDSEGGFLAPEDIINRIIARQPTPTRVAGYVSSINTSRDSIAIPKVNYSTDDLYTTGMRVTWTGEVPASSTAHRVTEPVFGQLRIPVYTAMMSIPVTRDLVEDSAVDLMGWLSGKFSETIDLLMDNMILNGSGVNQPTGILVNPNGTNQPATVVTGSASALTGDGLIDLTEAIPEQYDENSRLVFNKTNTGKAIRKLKDGDGRPLVSYGTGDSGLATGRYREVNGYPYIWSGFMPNVGASTYPIIFGDLNGYMLVRRIGFSIQVLRELYAETNQLLLLGRVRFGGMTAEEWRMRIQVCST